MVGREKKKQKAAFAMRKSVLHANEEPFGAICKLILITGWVKETVERSMRSYSSGRGGPLEVNSSQFKYEIRWSGSHVF